VRWAACGLLPCFAANLNPDSVAKSFRRFSHQGQPRSRIAFFSRLRQRSHWTRRYYGIGGSADPAGGL
jgi:hypothetical protein